MTKQQYLDYCHTLPNVVTDQPFDEDFNTWVIRHKISRKWIGIIMVHNGADIINLKCDPMEADFLRKAFEGITEAYHMNKTHWITVYLGSDVPDEELERITGNSYKLTQAKKDRDALKNGG